MRYKYLSGGFPTFNRPHNWVKAKCLLVLSNRKVLGRKPISAFALAAFTGESNRSILSMLPNWVKWRLVLRINYTEPYLYKIGAAGDKWLEKWQYIMPLDDIVNEILETNKVKT